MGVDRIVLIQGNGTDKPKKGDTGEQFDTSASRGDGVFETAIGVGQVIKGWDVGVLEMSVGERSILTISSDYAYGDRGFPRLIPPNSDLVFDGSTCNQTDVTLLSIATNSEVASSEGVSFRGKVN